MKKKDFPFAEIDVLAPKESIKIESITTEIQNEAPATPPKTPVVTFKPYKVLIETLLNIRRGPGYEYEIIGVLAQGTEQKIIEEKDEWGRIGRD